MITIIIMKVQLPIALNCKKTMIPNSIKYIALIVMELHLQNIKVESDKRNNSFTFTIERLMTMIYDQQNLSRYDYVYTNIYYGLVIICLV